MQLGKLFLCHHGEHSTGESFIEPEGGKHVPNGQRARRVSTLLAFDCVLGCTLDNAVVHGWDPWASFSRRS
jgi:hypothetical protein